MGIDVVGESQLVGYPLQFPSVSMIDCATGRPNARYWVLKLIHDHFAPGDKLVQTRMEGQDIDAQAFVTPKGHALLLINKRNARNTVHLREESKNARMSVVDSSQIRSLPFTGSTIQLAPFAVAVLELGPGEGI